MVNIIHDSLHHITIILTASEVWPRVFKWTFRFRGATSGHIFIVMCVRTPARVVNVKIRDDVDLSLPGCLEKRCIAGDT